jgi:hypothetical protein
MRPADLLDSRGRGRLAELQIPGLAPQAVEALLDRGAALGIMTLRGSRKHRFVRRTISVESCLELG